MLIRIVKVRKTQGAAQVVWSTGNVYSTLVGKCSEMAIWKQRRLEHTMMNVSLTWQNIGLSNDGNWHHL